MSFSKTSRPRQLQKWYRPAVLIGVLFWLGVAGLGGPPVVYSSSLIYKNYIVRYDRGWDILCEPYVVQKNDWVLKIFRQKGEIAHKDFRDFLGIFQRLNPHIKNINMIRPGQPIDIPLRKLEHGTLPGQATGVVTIPFVTLAKVMKVVQKHSQSYQVQRGDTVSQLLARHYGRYGTRSYREGVKLFQAANPEITNLDRIYAGQKVYLPDPSIREQAWYDSLYDSQGQLRETLDRGSAAPSSAGSANARPVPVSEPAEPAEPPQGPLAEVAAAVGGTLRSKGTYYVPRQGAGDFELDLSRHPLLDMQKETKILFTQDSRIMGVEKELLADQWPHMKVVAFDDQSTVEELVAAIFEAFDDDEGQVGTDLGFEDRGVQVAVRAKWVKAEKDRRHLAITPIGDASQQTPESIRRYLEQNGIVLKEILAHGDAASVAQDNRAQRHAVKNILALTPNSQKDFVQTLARTLGFTFAPNVGITFPYAGIQVKAYANLVSAGGGQELLVDFGDLYGDAVTAIRKTGLEVIQVTAEDSYAAIVRKLFTVLGVDYVENPTFLAARRPAQYNTGITIAGVLYVKAEGQRTLLSGATLHPAVTDLLSARGVDIVVW